MFKTRLFVVCVAMLYMACSDRPSNESGGNSAEETFSLLKSEGLSCGVQEKILAFDATSNQEFGKLVAENLPTSELQTVVANREKNCMGSGAAIIPSNSANAGEIESSTHAITQTYQVEFIEEVTTGTGDYPSSIYRDSSTYGWMCNSGSAENPADYIAQFHVSGAYANRSSLRIRGLIAFSGCYVGDPTAARVYSDDDIRACFGYWSVYFCTLGTGPTTYETVIYR